MGSLLWNLALALLRHSACSGENYWCERSLLYLHRSVAILLLLFIFMVSEDLLGTEISVRLCIWVAKPYVKECRPLSLPKSVRMYNFIKPVSGALLAPLFKLSPVISCQTSSISPLLYTMLSISASRLHSLLWRWMIKLPLRHTIA